MLFTMNDEKYFDNPSKFDIKKWEKNEMTNCF